MAYGDFKGLKVLIKYYEIKAFNIAKNPNYNRYQRGLASMVYNFFDKKTSGGAIKKETMANEELTKELSQPIIRKFQKREMHSIFTDNIGGTDLADIQLISKFN